MTQPKDIIEELRRARVNQRIAQFDLAETSGYDRTTIANYETGRRVPQQLQMLCNWAEALGQDLVLKPMEGEK
jgi:transcriptional regulator with XRE-family HTH domain